MIDTPETTSKLHQRLLTGGARLLGEMKEGINPYPLVFSGDTLENFLECAHIEKNKVIYRKIPTPGRHKETYFESVTMDVCLERAISNASQLGHTPIIMESRLFLPRRALKGMKTFTGTTDAYSQYSLPEGESFNVIRVWIPKEGFNWNDVDTADWDKRDRAYER